VHDAARERACEHEVYGRKEQPCAHDKEEQISCRPVFTERDKGGDGSCRQRKATYAFNVMDVPVLPDPRPPPPEPPLLIHSSRTKPERAANPSNYNVVM
jgi:hypothetical protein